MWFHRSSALISILLLTFTRDISSTKVHKTITSLKKVNNKSISDLSLSSSSSSQGLTRGGSTAAATTTMSEPGLSSAAKLLIGAGGIYGAFLYYGSLQEDVFRYTASDGSSFKQAWFLQVLEALANVLVGFVGMQIAGPTKGVPLAMFGVSGAAQVTAKACTSLALANGTRVCNNRLTMYNVKIQSNMTCLFTCFMHTQ
jgi:hypothetical protein